MKRVGIVCDNYKVKKFLEELEKEGFKKVDQENGVTQGTKLLRIWCLENQIGKVYAICKLCELHFKRGN